MDARIRLADPTDIEACGKIMYEAFKGINERHGFVNTEFPTAEIGAMAAGFWIRNPSSWSAVAEAEGCIVGSCLVDERSSVRGVAVISVDPAVQGQGVGRKLMEAALDRCRGSRGVRLAQHTFNTSSLALYASLGFEVKEPLVLMRGRLSSNLPGDVEVRPMHSEDLDACRVLYERIHGFERVNDVRDSLQVFAPSVALRAGRVVAYASAPAMWSANHGVAESEADMRALLSGICASTTNPISFLLPIRQTSLFRWCLDQGMQVVKPMTLMAMGEYQEPVGCYFPSVVF